MPRSEKQKEKLFRVFEILLTGSDEERGITLAQITERLAFYGISAERKSLYDDFICLEDLGFPVRRLPTRPATYCLATRPFTLAELKLLVDAVQSSRFITEEKNRALIAKLETFAGTRARELSRQVYVEGRVKTENSATMENIDALHAAIADGKTVSFAYFEYDLHKRRVRRHGGRRYLVFPKALLRSEENYYLVAYDEREEQIKNFRVDKMIDVVREETPPSVAARELDLDPGVYSERIFSMFGGEEELVTFEVKEKRVGVIIDRFGMGETFFRTPFGFSFSTRVMLSPTFYAWVMGFGGDIRILKPEHAVQEIRERIAAAGAAYDSLPNIKNTKE